MIRRKFLKAISAFSMIVTPGMPVTVKAREIEMALDQKLKLSLNAYSFNDPLQKGTMSLEDLLDFCAVHNFDAVDLTGYYFPGYPAVPPDNYIYHLKQKAHRLGLDISGTGVRNDFANPDKSKRKADIKLIKNWIQCAAKLGAPVIRVFSGNRVPANYSWDQVAEWMINDLKECVAFGEKHGVIVAIQNHHDFIKTAEETLRIIEAVKSEWFGLVLDIGSYRGENPYRDIEQTAKHAVNWQLKETMFFSGNEVKTDLNKVIAIIKSSGYRGYIPIETLGAGDPKIKVPAFLAEVRKTI